MNPSFHKNDLEMFKKYVAKATNYFEFGSGGSTVYVSKQKNIKSICSVESCRVWHDKVKKLITRDTIQYIFINMNTLPDTWGYPGPNSSKESWISYSGALNKSVDLILIDGRFRVACALQCFSIIDNNTIILFDDFLNRPEYHIVLDYYTIVEKTVDNVMVALKKKQYVQPSLELIQQYQIKAG